MAINYPTSLDNSTSLPTRSAGNTIPAVDSNDPKAAIIQLETKVGIGAAPAASATDGDVLTRQADGSTAWESPAAVPTTFDDLTDGTTNKAFTATEQTKLAGIGTGAQVVSVVAGTNVTVDDTDPQNPVVSASVTGGGGGDASTNTATSVDSEIALFSGTTGKLLKRATGTGIAKVTSGVLGTAVAADFPTLNQSTTGNAATATALQTPRTINGVSFDGSANITVADSTKVPTTRTVNGHALSADVSVTADDVLPTQTSNSGKFLTTNGTTSSWGTPTASVAWGAITGTLSSQTDLNTALSGKVATTTTVAGNALSANVTQDNITGLSSTGIVKRTAANTLAIATANTDYATPNQDTTGKSAKTDALNSATTVVNVAAATAPAAGQVLTATDSTHATWQTPSGGGGTSNLYGIHADACGANSKFLDSGSAFIQGSGIMPTYDTATYNGIVFDTSTVDGSGSAANYRYRSNYYNSWNNGTSWNQYWEFADVTSAGTNPSGNIFAGTTGNTIFPDGANFVINHIAIRYSWVSGTRTYYASSGDGTANTTVSFTPTNNNTTSNAYFIQKTPTSIKFFDAYAKTLIATITTNIPTASQQGIASLQLTNDSATRIKAILYNFMFSRQGTF